MIQSKTTSVTDAPLTGTEQYGMPTVLVELVHPKLGKVSFTSSSFGPAPADKTISGPLGRARIAGKEQPVCITVPRADFDAAMTEARAIGEREIAAIKSGETKIVLTYRDGEILSGYACFGRAADLLVKLGLAKRVDGWGTHVSMGTVEELGEVFTYAQAVELTLPATKLAEAHESAREAKRAEKFAEASATGKPVVLSTWTESVEEEDNSLNVVTEYAMPNGSTRTEAVPTH